MKFLNYIKIYNSIVPTLLLITLCNPANLYSMKKNWKYYFEKGKIQYIRKMYDYALYNLNVSLHINDKNYLAANYLGNIYIEKNIRIKALHYYKKSVSIEPNQPSIHTKIGLLYEFFSEDDKAMNHYKKALKFNSKNVDANLYLSRLLFKRKKIKHSKELFTIAYNEGLKKSQKFYMLGKSAEKKGIEYIQSRYDKASKIFNSVILYNKKAIKDIEKLKVKYTAIFFYKAIKQLNIRLGIIHYKRAILYYRIAINENPAHIEAYTAISKIARKMKKFSTAVKILEKLKSIKPDYEQAYILLAHLYFTKPLKGKRSFHLYKTIKYIKKAIMLNPNNKENYIFLSRVYFLMGKKDLAEKYQLKGM